MEGSVAPGGRKESDAWLVEVEAAVGREGGERVSLVADHMTKST